LLADCGHIALASGVRLLVEQTRLPMSDALMSLFAPDQAIQAALAGGDDYVLAFTLPPAHLQGLLDAGWPVFVVGRVAQGQGVVLIDEQGRDVTPLTRGYQHFRETR